MTINAFPAHHLQPARSAAPRWRLVARLVTGGHTDPGLPLDPNRSGTLDGETEDTNPWTSQWTSHWTAAMMVLIYSRRGPSTTDQGTTTDVLCPRSLARRHRPSARGASAHPRGHSSVHAVREHGFAKQSRSPPSAAEEAMAFTIATRAARIRLCTTTSLPDLAFEPRGVGRLETAKPGMGLAKVGARVALRGTGFPLHGRTSSPCSPAQTRLSPSFTRTFRRAASPPLRQNAQGLR